MESKPNQNAIPEFLTIYGPTKFEKPSFKGMNLIKGIRMMIYSYFDFKDIINKVSKLSNKERKILLEFKDAFLDDSAHQQLCYRICNQTCFKWNLTKPNQEYQFDFAT